MKKISSFHLPQPARSAAFSATATLTAVTALILAGCSDQTTKLNNPALVLKECRTPGVENAVQCGTYEVFENRETKAGRKIALNIVVLPASAKIKEPDPIFLFAGGPGQAATDLALQANAILGALNSKRDIVLIDQRGTGKSNLLTCKFPNDDTPESADPVKRRAMSLKLTTECRDTLAKKADLTQYTTTIAMADYDEVRAALGYSKINLWGGSYGTRSAQEYLRRYPESVRTMTIDGVASPSLMLPENFARDAGKALEAMFVACEKSPTCTKNYPKVRADFNQLLTSLEKTPRKVTITDPVTSLPRETTVTHDNFLLSIFSTLYVPQLASELPEIIKQASANNFAPLWALSGGFIDFAEDKIAFGMRLSVSCNEDVPRIDNQMRDAAKAVAPFGEMFIEQFSVGCEPWPKAKVPADFFTPVKSDKPVLILSGGLDPVTPQQFGDEVKKGFSNSVHFVAPNIGHGVSHQGCGPKLVKQFIEKASVEGLDGKCLERLPRSTFYQAMTEKKKSEETK